MSTLTPFCVYELATGLVRARGRKKSDEIYRSWESKTGRGCQLRILAEKDEDGVFYPPQPPADVLELRPDIEFVTETSELGSVGQQLVDGVWTDKEATQRNPYDRLSPQEARQLALKKGAMIARGKIRDWMLGRLIWDINHPLVSAAEGQIYADATSYFASKIRGIRDATSREEVMGYLADIESYNLL